LQTIFSGYLFASSEKAAMINLQQSTHKALCTLVDVCPV